MPCPMVMQRSFEGATTTNTWQNVYTNSISGDNLHGSINFIDVEAKGKTAFYRVVGIEEAAKVVASTQLFTSSPASALENKKHDAPSVP